MSKHNKKGKKKKVVVSAKPIDVSARGKIIIEKHVDAEMTIEDIAHLYTVIDSMDRSYNKIPNHNKQYESIRKAIRISGNSNAIIKSASNYNHSIPTFKMKRNILSSATKGSYIYD